MTIAEELLQDLRESLSDRAVPSVRALHLPRQAAAGRKDGEFCVLELEAAPSA